jgi:hypothetical protein
MQAPAWIDQFRDQLLETEAELRRLVRRHHHDKPPPGTTFSTRGARGGQGITIGAHEARTLLRAAMPVPMAVRHKRDGHADMLAALAGFAAQLLDLNDPYAGPQTVAGALDLADSLRAWAARMRWHQATAEAGAKWPAPLPIIELTRQQTSHDVPALFDAPAAAAAPARPRPKPRRQPADPQMSLLLPLPGRDRPASKSATERPDTARTPARRAS